MLLKTYCYSQYIQFIRNYYQLPNANEETESNKETIINFLVELHKEIGLAHIGENYIYDYLIYQFNYWIDKNVQFGDKITIKKVFALVSLKRYINRPTDFNWFKAKEQIEPYLSPIKEKVIKDKKLNQGEELEKQRFYNTKKGIANCLESTTLFNHRSSICASCKNRTTCKKLLQLNYPNIYKERGYE